MIVIHQEALHHILTQEMAQVVCYIWGAQVEEQSQATAYIKSDGIAAVRKSSTTNLVPYSEDFSQAGQKQNVTITANYYKSYRYTKCNYN